MKVVGYCRYSSDNQRAESIDAQKRAIEEYGVKNGYSVVKYYVDEAQSATSDNREQFLRMVEDSKLREWQGVVVHKLDRFARNREDSAIYKYKLKKSGVRVLSVLENLDGSPESVILESVLEGMNEYYSKNLSREVKKGMKENALNGLWNGGTPPLGYDVDKSTQKLVINPHEAEAIKIIFTMRAEGKSYKEIITRLNELGHRTKKAARFGMNSLTEILRNEKYVGTFIHGKITLTPSLEEGVKNHVEKSVAPIINEGGCPAIIDRETWDKVQRNRKTHRISHRASVMYLLRSKIFCGECGSRYSGSAMRSRAIDDYYYICGGKKSKKTVCGNRNIKKSIIEEAVADAVRQNVLTDAGIRAILNYVHERNNIAETKDAKGEIRAIDKQINALENKAERVKEMFLSGIIKLPELKEKNTEIEKQIELLTERKRECYPINVSDKDLIAVLEHVKADLSNNEKIINLLVDKVIIDGEQVQVLIRGGSDKDNRGGGEPRPLLSLLIVIPYSTNRKKRVVNAIFAPSSTSFPLRSQPPICPYNP